jgi:hypothetical protein
MGRAKRMEKHRNPCNSLNGRTMEALAVLVVQRFVAVVRHLAYLFVFGYPIIYVSLALFDLNLWTFAFAHVVVGVLWWIKPLR